MTTFGQRRPRSICRPATDHNPFGLNNPHYCPLYRLAHTLDKSKYTARQAIYSPCESQHESENLTQPPSSLPYLPLDILHAHLLTNFFIIIEPLPLTQINAPKRSPALHTGGKPLAIRFELDKLKSTAVKRDNVLWFRWRRLRV